MKDRKVPYLPQDFSACTNVACGSRSECWRSRPHPDAKMQTYSTFVDNDGDCDHFLAPPGAAGKLSP